MCAAGICTALIASTLASQRILSHLCACRETTPLAGTSRTDLDVAAAAEEEGNPDSPTGEPRENEQLPAAMASKLAGKGPGAAIKL